MNVYESIIKGLEEAIEYERGNLKLRTVTLELLDDGTILRREENADGESKGEPPHS